MALIQVCRRCVLAFVVVLGAVLQSIPAWAGEAFVLRLGTEGSATVVLSRESHTAFLTDGGRKSGLVGARIDGQSVAEMLKEAMITHLVVTCSHPHDDHLSGLVEFLTSNAVADLGLARIDFVESGYGEDSLYAKYEKHWKGKTPRPPESLPHSAKGQNAFAAITFDTGMTVKVENLVYTAKRDSGAHGHSVVTLYELKNENEVVRFVDFDDADTDVVTRYIEWVRAENNVHLEQRKPDVIIMPHHGTSLELTDVTGLFVDDIRPRDVIFTVNDENRYLHPSPRTLAYCLDKMTPDHVYFTAGSNNVVISGKGVQRSPGETSLSTFVDAIRPKLARVETKLIALRELSLGRELTGDQKRYFDRHESWLNSMYELIRRYNEPGLGGMAIVEAPTTPKGPSLFDNTGSYSQLVLESRELDRAVGEPEIASNAGGGGGGSSPPSRSPTGPRLEPKSSSGGGGGGIRVRGSGNGGFRGGSARFHRMFKANPIFGGVMLGNEYDASGLIVQDATIRVEDDEDGIGNPFISIVVKREEGPERTLIYDNMTATELWCAMRFVDPSAVSQEFGLNLERDDCGLVGITQNEERHDAWFFGIHPAISNTMLSQDAMRLDMVLESPTYLHVIEELSVRNYQWYDEPAVFRENAGHLEVFAHTEPSKSLLRVRLWRPSKTYEDPEHEVLRRLKDAAEKQGLSQEPACIVALWRLEVEQLLERLPERSNSNRDEVDILEVIEKGRRAYYERSSVSESAAVFLADAEEKGLKNALGDTSLAQDPNGELSPKELFGLVEREILALAKKYGPDEFESSDTFRLWQVLAPYKYGLSHDGGNRSAIREAVERAGLEESGDFRVWELKEDAIEQIRADLEPRNSFDVPQVIGELEGRFAPLRRMERFARLVSVVRWIMDDTGKLPKCEDGVKISPVRMNVPPVFFFDDVWESDQGIGVTD